MHLNFDKGVKITGKKAIIQCPLLIGSIFVPVFKYNHNYFR